jgi:diketogulonate reductase-like aldo/keto reductase
MKDAQNILEKLRADAAECLLISQLTPDQEKRATFEKLANQLKEMIQHLQEIAATGKFSSVPDP